MNGGSGDRCEDDICSLRNNVTGKMNADEDTKDETTHRDKHKNTPIDRGWAWVILVAAFFEMAIVIGYYKCFGIFFVQLQRRFHSTSAATSIIFSLLNACSSISVLLVMNLGQSMSSRISVVFGAIVMSASFFITGFAESLNVVYFTGGVMIGTFCPCIHPQMVNTLNMYFEKYRGLANNLAGLGASIGGLTLAQLYTRAFDYYGFTGTFMLQAGLTLNVVVIGMLLRPIDCFQRNNKRLRYKLSLDKDELVALRDARKSEVVDTLVESSDNNMVNNVNGHTLYGGHKSPPSLPNTFRDKTEQSYRCSKESNMRVNPLTAVFKIIKQQFINGLLRKRIFQYFLVFNVFLYAGCVVVTGFIAPHAVDVGIDDDRVSVLISAIAIADICSKFFFAYLSDRPWIKRSTVMGLVAIVLGSCAFLVFFMNSFYTLLAFSVVSGMLQPVYYSLYPVIAIDMLSTQELKSALGFIGLTQGITIAASFPLAGFLRDFTGKYQVTFCFSGTMLIIGGVLSYFLPNVKTHCERETSESEPTANEDAISLEQIS